MDSPQITLTPSRSALLSQHATKMTLLVQVKAPESTAPKTLRSPVALSIVLDRSGSMSGAPLEEAKRCARYVKNRLRDDDLVSLVSYNHKVSLEAPLQPPHEQRIFELALSHLDAGGRTDLFGGWDLGRDQLSKVDQSFGLKRVLILSDGQMNSGVQSPAEIEARVRVAAEQGVTTSTYGFGEDFDELIMRLISEAGLGNFRYGERVEDLFEAFEEELDLIGNLYATQLLMRLEPAEGVQVRCLNHLQERDGALLLPDLAYGAEVWTALELSVSPEAAQSGRPLINVRLEHAELSEPLSASLEALEAVSAQVFEQIAEAEVVRAYTLELELAQLKDEIAHALKRHRWELAIELCNKLLASARGNAQLLAEAEALHELILNRRAELASKEALSSSSRARKSMKLSRQSYLDPQSEVPSYMRRKTTQGRNMDGQS